MAREVNTEIQLQMSVVPQDWLDDVNAKIDAMQRMLMQKSQDEIDSQWIESAKAREMLGVSPKTWQTYRDEKRIPFSQFGRKIMVRRADIEAFIESHYIAARK